MSIHKTSYAKVKYFYSIIKYHKSCKFKFLLCLVLFLTITGLAETTFCFDIEIVPQKGHTAPVKSVDISPDGKIAVSGSEDNTIKLWDINSGQEIRTLKGHTNTVSSVSFSPDGDRVLSGSFDKTLKLWDVLTGNVIKTFYGHNPVIHSVDFSSDGKLALSGGGHIQGRDTTMRLWDISSGREIKKISFNRWIRAVAFSPEGESILGGTDGGMTLLDLITGKKTQFFHGGDIISVAFSPDGNFVLSSSENFNEGSKIKLWNAHTGQYVKAFGENAGCVAFSPDNKYAIVGGFTWGDGGKIWIWNISTGKITRIINVPTTGMNLFVVVTPDGSKILSGGVQASSSGKLKGIINLWDFSSGNEIITKGRFGNKP